MNPSLENSNNGGPSVPKQPAGSNVPNAAFGTSPAPQVAAPQANQSTTPVFSANNIHNTQATKPKEYFEEQNRKRAERKKKDNKNRQMIIIIGTSVLGALILVWAVWFLIIKLTPSEEPQNGIPVPVMTSGDNEEIADVVKYIQSRYGDVVVNAGSELEDSSEIREKLDEANAAVEQVLTEQGGTEYQNQILFAQLQFYVNNGFYAEAVAMEGGINLPSLTLEQQGIYYNFLARAYSSLGDTEASQRNFKTSIDILVEAGGIGG